MTVFLCSKAPKRCEEKCCRMHKIDTDCTRRLENTIFFLQFLKIQIEPFSVSLEGSSYQESTVCLT